VVLRIMSITYEQREYVLTVLQEILDELPEYGFPDDGSRNDAIREIQGIIREKMYFCRKSMGKV
jgi:hypothetical protein